MEQIKVEVAYATPEKQIIIPLTVVPGTSVANAITLSGLEQHFQQLSEQLGNISQLQIGVFGKKINPDTYQLQDNDRIEIYRPLTKTPNQRRLERAKNNAK